MIKVSIMIEGQNGLNWPRWQRIAQVVDQAGFAGLFRSDHVTNANPPELDSLELWTSLTWLASHTQRVHFGPLVSPVSFRDPVHTARMASAVDDLSGGRLVLGLGAGWNDREHTMFGWDLLDLSDRFERFEEGLEVISALLHSRQPVSYSGEYYHLKDAILLPGPARPGEPPILIGGNGVRFTLPLVVRFASIWNAVFITPERFSELNKTLSEMLEAAGKPPASVDRTLMTNLTFGWDDARLKTALQKHDTTLDVLRGKGNIAGTSPEVVEQLSRCAEAGVQEVMLQWLDLDDISGLEDFARLVLPQINPTH